MNKIVTNLLNEPQKNDFYDKTDSGILNFSYNFLDPS